MFGKTPAPVSPTWPAQLLSDDSPQAREQIERLFTPVRIAQGRVLIAEGSVGREFFVITDGRALVTRDGEEVGQLGEGECFGEIALLEGERRTATVQALTDMEVWVANPREFRALLANHRAFAEMVTRVSDARKLALAS